MENPISRAEHEEFVKRMEAEHMQQNRRITLLEDNVQLTQSLALSVEKMAFNMENMLKEQQKQGERLETLENIPKKNMDSFKFALLGALGTALGGGVITFIIKIIQEVTL